MKPKYPRISVIRFAQSLLPRFRAVIRDERISALALILLYEVALLETKSEPVGVAVLREILHTDASIISRELSKMLKRKLIRRDPGPEDARFRVIRLTKEGEKLLDRVDIGLMFAKDDGPIVPGDRERIAWGRVGSVSAAIARDEGRLNRNIPQGTPLFDHEASEN